MSGAFLTQPTSVADLEARLAELSLAKRVKFIQVELIAPGLCFGSTFVGGTSLDIAPQPIAIGCIAELAFAVLALELDHKGQLDLDAPVVDVLPELSSWRGEREVTLRHLLARASGLQDPRSPVEAAQILDWASLSPRLLAAPKLLTPGLAVSYAGIEMPLLITALERAIGDAAHAAVRRWVLEPMEIRPAVMMQGRSGSEVSGLGVTVADLIRFAAELAPMEGGGILDPRTALKLGARRTDLSAGLMLPPQAHAPAAFSEGAFVYSDGLVGFDGQAFGQACGLRVHPATDVRIAVCLDGPPAIRDKVLEIAAEVAGFPDRGRLTPPCPIGRLEGLESPEICGAYRGWAIGHEAVVTRTDGGFVLTRSFAGRAIRSLGFQIEEDLLTVEKSLDAAPLRFFRDGGSGAVGLACGAVPYAMV